MKCIKLVLVAFLLTVTVSIEAQLTLTPVSGVQKLPGHYIGEKYGGGIVFYIYDKGEHGLIVTTDPGIDFGLNGNRQWYNGTERFTGSIGDGLGSGIMNTAMIVAAQAGEGNAGVGTFGMFAARSCADFSTTVGGITYGDWYLPSKYELNLLYLQKDMIGGFEKAKYWSSSEVDAHYAWYQNFADGIISYEWKGILNHIRAIRAF